MPAFRVSRTINLLFALITAVCLTSKATAQTAEKPDDNASANEAGADVPVGFVAAKVKAGAPEEIRAFFEASDKARLAAIKVHRGRIDAANATLKSAQRRRLKSDDIALAAENADADLATYGPAVAALLKDVGFVAPFETMVRGAEPRFLKLGLILRFGNPVTVVRVIDKDRAIITVEQQFWAPKRLNKAGQVIEPIASKRAQAVVKTDTTGMRNGARSQIAATLRITGTEAIDGSNVFVLEPFVIAEYIEE